ncbi:MAG: hypothetical protein ACHQAZ_01920 [Gammaproteobacteria bacterium]
MSKLLMTCGLVVALTACASSQPSPSASSSASGASGQASATATPAAQSGTATAVAKPKLICEDTAQMGSHFQQRVCMTPEQAEARRKAAQAAMQNYQNSTVSACGDNGCSGGPPR